MTSADINAAIAACPGGVVTLPNGEHPITDPLVLKSGVIVRGESPTGCVLRMQAGSNGPCFTSTSYLYRWGVESLTVDYRDRGQPSLHEDDSAFRLHTGAWQFRVADIDVRYAHRAWDATFEAFMGRVERVVAWFCRHAFRHHTGTTMGFSQCFARGGRDQAGFPAGGAAWDLAGVVGCTLDGCAFDHWDTAVAFAALHMRGLTVQSLDWESNTGGTHLLFRDCAGAWLGSHGVGNVAADASVWCDGGQMTLQGVALGGAPRAHPDAGTGATLKITGGPGTAVSMAGGCCYPLAPGQPAIRHEADPIGSRVSFLGVAGVGGDIEAWGDYPNIVLRHRDGSQGLRLHRAKDHITVIDAALPMSYRDETGKDVLWMSHDHVFVRALRGPGQAPVRVSGDDIGLLRRGSEV